VGVVEKSWLVRSTILDLLDAHKWTGAELWKRPFRVMTFKVSSSNGARWRLIEINGVLFAVPNCRVQQKRNHLTTRHLGWASILHRILMSTKTHTETLDEQTKWTIREEKHIQQDKPAWTPGRASATPWSQKIPVFDCAVALCKMKNSFLVISNLTWLLIEKVRHTFEDRRLLKFVYLWKLLFLLNKKVSSFFNWWVIGTSLLPR
jgi:hypothetical protein